MNGDREGLGEGRVIQTERGWQGHTRARGSKTELCQPTVSHQAESCQSLAEVNLVALAPEAVAAIDEGIRRDPIPSTQPLHRGAGSDDLTGKLVPQDQRRPRPG
jgi:hypothetical protein